MSSIFHSTILSHLPKVAFLGAFVVLLAQGCGYKAKPFYKQETSNSESDSQTSNSKIERITPKAPSIKSIDSFTIGEDEGD